MKKQKILILSTAYAPFWGGAEIAIKEITDRLGMNFDFFMLTSKLDERDAYHEEVGAVTVERLGNKYMLPFQAPRRFKELHKEHKFDLVWTMMASHAGIAGLRIKKKYPNIPYFLTLQSGDSDLFWNIRTLWWRPWFKKVYQIPDHIQVISSFLERRARSYGYRGKISVVPNGVDNQKFQIPISKFQTNELRKELNLKENEKTIITTSRLVRKNAVDVLIRSIQFVKTPANLLVVGAGKLEQKLKSLAIKLGLEQKVIFTGHVEYNDLPLYLAIADVFVRPSRSEGLGNSFIEAMAAGVPIIGTPVGGIVDFLEDKKTGLFCKVNDPKDTALAIDEMLTDGLLSNKLIKNAQNLVREKYDWDNIAKEMARIFNSLQKQTK